MTRPSLGKSMFAASVIACAALAAGCIGGPGIGGSFDRTLTVSGPVELQVATGSGDVRIAPGATGEVRIHGEIHARGWTDAGARQKLQQIESNPPISQDNNLIRVGGSSGGLGQVSIDYTITVPANTELHSRQGSGNVDARGIQGPANFVAGSGTINASSIGGDVQGVAGSGNVTIAGVQGQTQVTAGSGEIVIRDAKGPVRAHGGSGNIEVSRPSDAVVAETGSGDIRVDGATADLRVRTGSGNVSISGNPGASNYWDLHASSGDVSLRIPSNASFHLYAHSSSGDIRTQVPIVMEGSAGKHELRAHIGDGKARVEIETSSGNITLR